MSCMWIVVASHFRTPLPQQIVSLHRFWRHNVFDVSRMKSRTFTYTFYIWLMFLWWLCDISVNIHFSPNKGLQLFGCSCVMATNVDWFESVLISLFNKDHSFVTWLAHVRSGRSHKEVALNLREAVLPSVLPLLFCAVRVIWWFNRAVTARWT